MTEDYKDTLLRYFTGNLKQETGNNIPLFTEEQETLNNNVYENIETILGDEQGAVSFLPLGKIYNETYGAYLIYGYYEDLSYNPYGFIYLVDDELNEIQMITEFASGTKLFPLVSLNQAEDGNIYGLSHTVGTTPGTLRVMLFNNIFSSGLLTGEYKAVLRNDYIVPYSYYPARYRQNGIIKSVENPTYYIVLNDGSNNTHIVKFTINVGSTNDWEDYTISGLNFYPRYDVLIDKSSGNEIFYFYGLNNSNYYEYQLEEQTLTQNKVVNLEATASFTYSQVFVANISEIYIYACYSSLQKGTIYRVLSDGTLETIDEFSFYVSGGNTYLSSVNLFLMNGGVFYSKNYSKDIGYDIYMGYIINNTNTEISIGSSTANFPGTSFYSYVDFYYTTLYNLINIYIPIYDQTNTTERLTFDYSSINYNGEPYEFKQSLVPQKGRIFDENNKMIFSRNLYNKIIYGNTTLSQVQVPNTLLNDATLNTSNLIGRTNKILVNSNDNVTKNIYETLYFNYYNTLMIQDRNTGVYVDNMVGANRINGSVSNVIDYENAKATKYRVNYSDNTSLINSLDYIDIVENLFNINSNLYNSNDASRTIEGTDLIVTPAQGIVPPMYSFVGYMLQLDKEATYTIFTTLTNTTANNAAIVVTDINNQTIADTGFKTTSQDLSLTFAAPEDGKVIICFYANNSVLDQRNSVTYSNTQIVQGTSQPRYIDYGKIATYEMEVYVPTTKTITNVEIISEDENTIYQTISGLSLETGKSYNIKQDCYVE